MLTTAGPMARRTILALAAVGLVLGAPAAARVYGQSAGLPKEPFLVMWQVQKNTPDADLDLLAKYGIDYIQSFGLTQWSDAEIKTYLDRAQQRSMKVIVYLGKLMTAAPQQRLTPDARKFIDTWKSHPGVGMWHVFDEPAGHKVPKPIQEAGYRFVKEADPSHPVLITMNAANEREYREYFTEKAFDVLDVHKYVNPNIARGQIKQVELLKDFKKGRAPLMTTFRAYDAPEWKTRRKAMTDNALDEQYDFYVKKSGIRNIGFYGWALHPNKGIADDPELRTQWIAFMEKIGRGSR